MPPSTSALSNWKASAASGKRQRLDLTDTNGNPVQWILILGDNGVGKTTLLQCLAWMRPVPHMDSETERI